MQLQKNININKYMTCFHRWITTDFFRLSVCVFVATWLSAESERTIYSKCCLANGREPVGNWKNELSTDNNDNRAHNKIWKHQKKKHTRILWSRVCLKKHLLLIVERF